MERFLLRKVEVYGHGELPLERLSRFGVNCDFGYNLVISQVRVYLYWHPRSGCCPWWAEEWTVDSWALV